MLAASMEAPSYGAARLPFTIRHRPTLYVTKLASCSLVSISWRQRRGDPESKYLKFKLRRHLDF